jgi:hypothetical protein
MAVGPALVTLGHVALTVKEFHIFWMMVMDKPVRDESIRFFRCSHVNQKWPREPAILQSLFLPGHSQEFYLALQLGVLGLQFCQGFLLVLGVDSVCSDAVCHHRESSASDFCTPGNNLSPTFLLLEEGLSLMAVSSNAYISAL